MRNAHCMTWSMPKKLKIMVNEKHTLQEVKIKHESLKNEKNEKNTLQDQAYCEKTEKRGK